MAGGAPRPRIAPQVFTVAPGQDFAAEVVGALLAGRLIDLPFAEQPHYLADLLIYVPTQRLRAILEAEFARRLAPRPVILPKIRPLADPGDPLDRLAGRGGNDPLIAVESSKRVIGASERRFMLMPLVAAWRNAIRAAASLPGDDPAADDGGITLREQLGLADELGRLIDEMRISGVELAKLASSAPTGYDPAKFDAYWAKSREFLAIAANFWPQRLNDANARDETEVQLAAIEAETARLERGADGPILVIGSTGSVAATAGLMRAVARLRHGAVILPGLDQRLDARGWDEVGAQTATLATRFAHPQATLKRLLAIIGAGREDVVALGVETPEVAARNRMLSEALRPAESIDLWRTRVGDIDLPAALAGLGVIEAAEEHEEALAVAILMRETLETPDAEVAFVTANRGLARRVRAALLRWNISAEDSAGTTLAETPVGTFLLLLLHAATAQDGSAILALLRHPLARFGFAREAFPVIVDALEMLVLRGRHFSAAQSIMDRVRHALAYPPYRPHPGVARLPEAACAALPTLARALDDLLMPFAPGAKHQPFGVFAGAIGQTLRQASADEAGISALEDEPEAGPLMDLLDSIGRHAGGDLADADHPVAPEGLAGALDLLMRETTLPPRGGHQRAAILGQLESRLVQADRVIIGGLNEGSFPPMAEEGPFLNRAMRLDLGLQPPERRIGQSAHDFTMLAGHRDLYLTRAKREGEQPAMASRFLRRLCAFVGDDHWKAATGKGARYIDLARRLDAPGGGVEIRPPSPVPAGRRIPEKLSITEIETLRRDPYEIYARHILNLHPLEPVDPEIDNRERGTVLHACLEDFARRDPPLDPAEAAQLLREIGETHFAAIRQEKELYHFWWQRFLAIIPDFVAFDRERRDAGWHVLTEIGGKFDLALPSGLSVIISGKVDRIETGPEGALAIFDYKSGAAPTAKDIAAGLAPQLPVTAALARRGAFRGVPEGAAVAEMAHVLIGGTEPLESKRIKSGTDPAETLDTLAEANWQALISELDDLATGRAAYLSRLKPRAKNREGAYDHLARVREWQSAGLDDADGPEEAE